MRQIHTLSVLLVVGVAGLALAQSSAERRHDRSRSDAESGARASQVAGLQKACDSGSCEACGHLAEMYRKGEGVARDESRAAHFQARACKQARRPGAAREVRSVRGLERACEDGEALACRKLGSMYENGEEVVKDEARAARYFRMACDGDNALGCFRLGLMYDLGNGLKRDRVRAIKLYVKACDGGEKFACFNLGNAFEDGNGVPRDLERAVRYYRKSCDLGNSDGCDKASVRRQGAKKDRTSPEQRHSGGERRHR